MAILRRLIAVCLSIIASVDQRQLGLFWSTQPPPESPTHNHTRRAADKAPVRASFSQPQQHQSNFGQLRIKTNGDFSDSIQMQAAGFAEGYLTAGPCLLPPFAWMHASGLTGRKMMGVRLPIAKCNMQGASTSCASPPRAQQRS